MVKAYVEITLTIKGLDRAGVATVYTMYKEPFLKNVKGALSKELLVHVEDIQVLHGFDNVENAQKYLMSDFFNLDVVLSLKPYLKDEPNIKIYCVA